LGFREGNERRCLPVRRLVLRSGARRAFRGPEIVVLGGEAKVWENVSGIFLKQIASQTSGNIDERVRTVVRIGKERRRSRYS